jgi:hypothetical protein
VEQGNDLRVLVILAVELAHEIDRPVAPLATPVSLVDLVWRLLGVQELAIRSKLGLR